jgi:hypothetical protein
MYNPPENLSEEDSLILGDMLESKGGGYKIKYKLDLHRFLTDPDYASDYIHYYDLIKASFNPLKIFKY